MARRFALIIGNSTYDDRTLSKLKTPEADVSTLASALRDPQLGGFDEVQEMVNQTEASVRRAISAFYLQKKSDDLLLLYFSGHGVLDAQGRLFLAVKDSQRELLNATAIPASFITDDMDACRSKRQILILDCCHSGAFARGAKGDAPAVTQSTFEGTGFGRVVLTASDSTQYALEGDQVIEQASLSLFTHYLLEGLTTGQADSAQDGLITLDEWYDYAYDRVVSETPEQTPRKWVYNQQGELIIARNPNPLKPEPTDLPDELKLAVESPFVGVRQDAVEELTRLLRGSNPAMAQAAFLALQNLASHDDSRRIASAAEDAIAGFKQGERPAGPLADRLARDEAAEILEAEQAEAARIAAEKEAERQAREKAESERLARQQAEQAEAERRAREKAQSERLAAEKAEAERLARQQAEQAEAERSREERAEAERQAGERRSREPGIAAPAQVAFIAELKESKLNAGETGELGIRIAGRVPASFSVDFDDASGALEFTPAHADLTVQPSETAAVRFLAVPRKRPLITYFTHPFTARITASSGDVQALTGAVVARPRAPAWAIFPALGLALCCLISFGIYQWLIAPGLRVTPAPTLAAVLQTDTPPAPLATPLATQPLPLATTAVGIIPAVGTPTAFAQHPSPTPPSAWMTRPSFAYATNRDGNWEIYLQALNGSHLTRLTDDPHDDSFPVFSPDGRKILFHSDRAGNFDIFVMNTDGSGVTQLTDDMRADTYASWSPDGKQIVFQSKRDGLKEIYVMNADGSRQVRLTHNDVDDQFPAWSPDGSQILYTSVIEKVSQLFLMNADGSDPHQLTFGHESFSFPAWSPDGVRIAAAYSTPDKEEIVLGQIRPDGSFEYTGLTSEPGTDTQPRWSPDGGHIYFSSNRNGNFDIYRMDADGSAVIWLTVDPPDDEAPSMSDKAQVPLTFDG